MGKAFTFGDGITTDALSPGRLMKLPADELATYCLNTVDPGFASSVKSGDFVIAGNNFGQGSSREQAAISLKVLGVTAVLAKSFARIFYRNAINIGLPVVIFPEVDEIKAGDELVIDLKQGLLSNLSQDKQYKIDPLPPALMEIVESGGLIAQLEQRFNSKAK